VNERMPAWSRIVFAVGSTSGNIIGRTRDLWLLFFYVGDGTTEHRGSATGVIAVLVLVRLIEAFNDPLIGHLSDRTRSRLGRRIPYVLASTPLMALAFIFLWTPPDPGETSRNVIYLFAVLSLFHLFLTSSGGPAEALFPEIARRHDDRMSISLWQMVFGLVGTVFALMVSGPVKDAFGFPAMAVFVAAIGMATRLFSLAGAWTRSIEAADEVDYEERLSVWQSMRGCLQNRQFLLFLPSHVLYSIGIQMFTGALPFLVARTIGGNRQGTMVSLITGAAMATLLVSLPLIVVAARKSSKRAVYRLAMLFSGLYLPLQFFAGYFPGIPAEVQLIVFAALLGPSMAPVFMFPNALIADICDYDQVKTGKRREGVFYAMHATIEKTAGAAAPALLGLLLLIPSTGVADLGLRLIGPVAGVITLVGYLFMRFYWLPDEVTPASVWAGTRAVAIEMRKARRARQERLGV
jgi:GPH family glycoside/pentoside/hexuronide:cation symporter